MLQAVEVEEHEVRQATEEVVRERATEVGTVQVNAGDHHRHAAVGLHATTVIAPPSGHTCGAIDALVCARVCALPQRQHAARDLHRGFNACSKCCK
jgi:hypothetical protein